MVGSLKFHETYQTKSQNSKFVRNNRSAYSIKPIPNKQDGPGRDIRDIRHGAGGKATMAQVKSSRSVLSAAIIYPLRSKKGGGLSAAVTIEPVIESHLFLLPDEVKRPNGTPDPKSDQLFSQTRPRAALFLPGLRHAHTLLFVRPFLCGSILVDPLHSTISLRSSIQS